ncbi:MAG: dihydrolipoamide acetyltransferase family protein [Bryobacteraceae bacterium]
MAIPVEMPKLGNTVEEAILVAWKKAKGDPVASGEIIAEIETDKATFELPAPASGTILELFVKEGDLVPVYTHICVIGEPGEAGDAFRPGGAPPDAPPRAETEPQSRATPSPASKSTAGSVASAAPSSATAAPLSPRARRYLEERGLAAPPISGSGPGGRVLEQDLRDYYAEGPRLSALARKQLQEGYQVAAPGSGGGGRILARDLEPAGAEMPKIRQIIARRMRESLASSAQYTLHSSADATGLLALRARIKAAGPGAPEVNINDLVMFCTVQALLEMPALNAELIDGKVYRRAEINLGFACDTDRGLLVPVVRGCEKLTVVELAARVRELTRQALAGSISPDDLTGGTFTVTNLGSLGIESFTPILNVPQVAILGVDTIQPKLVRKDSRVEIADYIGLSLTCDHQVIDGAPGARFLKVLREKIEQVESIAGLRF